MMILDKNGNPLASYMKHGTSHSLQQFYQSHDTGRRRLASLPICPKCEKVGFRDKGWLEKKNMCCPACGYTGPTTHILSAYAAEGLYK